jgi:hypothetical protein
MATKIQVRRDTAADWTSTNPTLAAGEIGFESDTNKFKIGDGATAWTSLNYAPEGYATTSYVDTQDANIASDTLTFTNKTFDANGTGNSISNIETADFATAAFKDEDTMSSNSDTAVASQQSIKAYVDAEDANIASDTLTFTNKTFDANGTGNSISNIETADIAAGTLVTAAEGIGSNNNDTTIPTSAAVKAYADSVGGGGASLGDLTATGSTLTAPSNGTLALETSGTGKVVLAANNGNYESGLSSTRYDNSNNLFYENTSETLNTGTQRYMNTMTGRVTLTSGQATSTNSNDRWMNQNVVRLDMNGNSSTNSSSTYRSRGPRALSNYTTIVNGGAGASTLGNATASLNGVYSYLNNQDLTITAATGVNSTLEFESDGTADLNVTEWRAYQSFADAYGSSGSLNVTNFYHYYCDTPNGNITNQYAFYDATNSLSVFGDIQTQAVSITDNTISTNRSNDDLNIKTSGTGRINFSQDGSNLSESSQFSTYWGSHTSIRDFSVYKSTTDDADTVQRNYLAAFTNQSTLTNSSSTNSNFRPRTVLSSSLVDMAGYSYTQSSLTRGPLAFGAVASVTNSSTTASTIDTVRGLENAAGGYAGTAGLIAGDVTIKRAIASYNTVYAANDGTGGAGNYTVDDGYGIYVNAYTGGGSDVISNMYGFYYAGGGTISNNYAFYDATNSLSVFGDIQTQAVSITDNLIKSNRSNDNLNFQTNGTGRFNFGDSQTFNVDWQSLYGADNRVTDFALIREESKDANTSGFEFMAGFHHDVQLTGSSSTNSNFRPRGLLSLTTLDHAGYSYTRAGLFRGPLGAAFGALSMNSSTTAATLANNRGLEIAHGAYTFNSATAQGDVTITDSTGCMAISYSANDDTGTTADFNVTNAYAFRSGYYVFGNASSMTNHYGYYYHGDEYGGGTQPTNIYAFYDNANKLSRFGAVILANQAGDPSGVADSAHIYAKDVTASSEVFVRDEAGNVTQISPHNEAGEWQYWSENIKTGKKVRVNMERMIRKLEEITGETFIENE